MQILATSIEHRFIDATSQLPMKVKVTPGNESDTSQAIPLLKGALKKHLDCTIKTSVMGSGYDCHENYCFAINEAQVTSIIAPNPGGGVDAFTANSLQLAKDGSSTLVWLVIGNLLA